MPYYPRWLVRVLELRLKLRSKEHHRTLLGTDQHTGFPSSSSSLGRTQRDFKSTRNPEIPIFFSRKSWHGFVSKSLKSRNPESPLNTLPKSSCRLVQPWLNNTLNSFPISQGCGECEKQVSSSYLKKRSRQVKRRVDTCCRGGLKGWCVVVKQQHNEWWTQHIDYSSSVYTTR